VDSEEEDERAKPHWDHPFPKWYTQLLDGVDIPCASSKEVSPKGPRRLESQHKTRVHVDVEEEPTVHISKRIEEQRLDHKNIVNYISSHIRSRAFMLDFFMVDLYEACNNVSCCLRSPNLPSVTKSIYVASIGYVLTILALFLALANLMPNPSYKGPSILLYK